MHRARKRFGQHFLHDRNVIDRIVQAIDPQPDDKLVEIGPGQGALTWPLLQRCSRLTAIELDRDLVPVLQREATRYGELEVVNLVHRVVNILKGALQRLQRNRRGGSLFMDCTSLTLQKRAGRIDHSRRRRVERGHLLKHEALIGHRLRNRHRRTQRRDGGR